MELIDMGMMCRTCLKYSLNSISIYTEVIIGDETHSYISLLDKITSDGLNLDSENLSKINSNKICPDCVEFLDKILEFRFQCIGSLKTLTTICNAIDNQSNEAEECLVPIKEETESDKEFTNNIDIESELTMDELKELDYLSDEINDSEIEELYSQESDENNSIYTLEFNENIIPELSENDELQVEVQNNKRPKHNLPKNGLCYICGGDFKDLAKHIRLGHPNFECPYCNKKFSAPSILKIHMTKHTGEKKFKCEICGKASARYADLQKHIRIHTGERPYQCDICGQKYKVSSHMVDHKKTHSEVPMYKCDICSKSFYRRKNMRDHQKKVHERIKKSKKSKTATTICVKTE